MIPDKHQRAVAALALVVGFVTAVGAVMELAVGGNQSASSAPFVFMFQSLLLISVGTLGLLKRPPAA